MWHSEGFLELSYGGVRDGSRCLGPGRAERYVGACAHGPDNWVAGGDVAATEDTDGRYGTGSFASDGMRERQ